jgi:hypothetical protein
LPIANHRYEFRREHSLEPLNYPAGGGPVRISDRYEDSMISERNRGEIIVADLQAA